MKDLKDCRKTLQLTQTGLAKLSGLPRWVIQLIEYGDKVPSELEKQELYQGLKLGIERKILQLRNLQKLLT